MQNSGTRNSELEGNPDMEVSRDHVFGASWEADILELATSHMLGISDGPDA